MLHRRHGPRRGRPRQTLRTPSLTFRPDERVFIDGRVGPAANVQVTRVARAIGNQEAEVPTLAPACTYTAPGSELVETADPAVRSRSLFASFGTTATTASICSADLGAPMAAIAARRGRALGVPCLQGDLADGDNLTAAIEPTCDVTEAVAAAGAVVQPTTIPRCADEPGAATCWRTVVDARRCGDSPTALSLDVQRVGAPAPGAVIHARCALRTTAP